jgi:hypothetical protein
VATGRFHKQPTRKTYLGIGGKRCDVRYTFTRLINQNKFFQGNLSMKVSRFDILLILGGLCFIVDAGALIFGSITPLPSFSIGAIGFILVAVGARGKNVGNDKDDKLQ